MRYILCRNYFNKYSTIRKLLLYVWYLKVFIICIEVSFCCLVTSSSQQIFLLICHVIVTGAMSPVMSYSQGSDIYQLYDELFNIPPSFNGLNLELLLYTNIEYISCTIYEFLTNSSLPGSMQIARQFFIGRQT